MRRSAPTAGLGLALALTLLGCTVPAPTPTPAPPPPPAQNGGDPLTGPVQPVGEPEVIATGLTLPWSLVRLSAGSTLVSERDTAVVKEVSDSGEVREVGTVPGVQPGGEGGLLGLEVSDDEAWLYAYTTTASDNRVIRMPLEGDAGGYSLGSSENVFTGIPKSQFHNGGRIKFGPDGLLYIATGDATDTGLAQNLNSVAGKILRVEADGAVPANNPFGDSPVYSYGHRNAQGLAWADDGTM